MSENEDWPMTMLITEVNGVARPGRTTKQVFAVSAARYACDCFGWSLDTIEKDRIAPYINAIGGIHGNDTLDVPGDRYAQFALKVLRLIGDSHIKSRGKTLSESAKDWLAENEDCIANCREFFQEVFQTLGPSPSHGPELPANQQLLDSGWAETDDPTKRLSTKEMTRDGMFGDAKYQVKAQEALPILVEYAEKEESVTYGELANKLNMPFVLNLNKILGAIGNTLEALSDRLKISVPLINTLVVNKNTGLPGKGVCEFFKISRDGFLALPPLKQIQLIEKYHADIFSFDKWDLVLRILGLKQGVSESDESAEVENDLETEVFLEGGHRLSVTKLAKRNPKARLECLAHYGYDCQVCGFNFGDYGEIGEGYIQVHHREMLSTKDEEYEIDPINDLAPVCANCHVMMHKRKEPYSVEELREKLFA